MEGGRREGVRTSSLPDSDAVRAATVAEGWGAIHRLVTRRKCWKFTFFRNQEKRSISTFYGMKNVDFVNVGVFSK